MDRAYRMELDQGYWASLHRLPPAASPSPGRTVAELLKGTSATSSAKVMIILTIVFFPIAL